MDLNSATGAFINKEPIGDKLRWFSSVLAMISLVHERGTMKYVSYSWMADPTKSNSTMNNNLDAIERHLDAHSMGKLMDPEGLPHIFHLACRAGMLVTTAMRDRYGVKDVPIRDKREAYASLAASMIGSQLTAEEIIACSKQLPAAFDKIKQMSADELLPLVRGYLVDLHLKFTDFDPLPSNQNLFEAMSDVEILFQLICYYVRAYWICHRQTYTDLITQTHAVTPYRDEDRSMLSIYLGVHLEPPKESNKKK